MTDRTKRVSERTMRGLLVAGGLSQIALGGWQAIAPGSFFSIAGFGVENPHYIRDVSTFYLALGCALLVSVLRPAWRTPVLAFATLQYAMHLVNHVADVGEGHPSWVGPVDAIAVALGAVLFGLVLYPVVRGEAS